MQNKKIIGPHIPFWLITLSVMIGLTLPKLIQDGMFMDAVLYSSVSHNLSLGIGSFWFPQFSLHNVAGLSSFHEQPPLVFGIQSLFYSILGDSIYVERLYTFVAMSITALLIVLIWREIYKNEDNLKKMGWLPVLLWITIPVCFWSFSNNMHENTMGIFTLSAVLLTFKSFRSEKFRFVYWVFAGIFIFLATLSKGLPGFFPVLAPFLFWLTNKHISFKQAIYQTIVIMIVLLLIYTILFIIPESRESLSIYLFKRALHRINEVPTVDNRFYIIGRLFMELIPQLVLVTIVLSIAAIKRIEFSVSKHLHLSTYFITIGLSGSLPIMFTMVQKGFYFVPSLPFFAIGLSVLIAPQIFNLFGRIDISSKKFTLFVLSCVVLFIATSTFAGLQKGKTSRNKEMLHDVYLIGTVVPKHTTISIPSELWNAWDLKCYLVRYFNISSDPGYVNKYYMQEKTNKPDTLSGYKRVGLKTIKYDLYRKQ
jgi:4-amino-4-deoxy-L-arabinose transferase-like glycosyltransferase